MIPFVQADGQTNIKQIPPGVRYVLGKGGTYIQRNSALFVSCVQGKISLPGLEEVLVGFKLKTPKLSLSLLNQAVAFFEHVEDQHRSEAALILVYDQMARQFLWHCPPQQIEWGRVRFEYPLDLPAGQIAFGDMHSHPCMSPDPSYQDQQDEQYRDGIHLIVGYIGDDKWRDPKPLEIVATFSVDGTRLGMKLDNLIEGMPDRKTCGEFPPEWLEQVTKPTYSHSNYKSSYYQGKDWHHDPHY